MMVQSLSSVVVLARTEIYRSELIVRRDGASPRRRFKSGDISPPPALIVHRFIAERSAFCESCCKNMLSDFNILIRVTKQYRLIWPNSFMSQRNWFFHVTSIPERNLRNTFYARISRKDKNRCLRFLPKHNGT